LLFNIVNGQSQSVKEELITLLEPTFVKRLFCFWALVC
jgi:hypothetical protein